MHLNPPENGVLYLVTLKIGSGENAKPVIIGHKGVNPDRIVDESAVGFHRCPVCRVDPVEKAECSVDSRVTGAKMVAKQNGSFLKRGNNRHYIIILHLRTPTLDRADA